ncbi:DUF2795 domain-containing protein [Actinophytocola algeriensis]|uniref:DUF2795 domain-containing protein n=1 Tax=Actinophytocola algeriensis TaxID=1768010 RepID=A0A7W7VGH1_9PSEU|nr:hypothetical protein [Actinophytocola algeriensis]MBB4909060.1 hypothetical protein [Actinophytocola algeriensis]MBE1474552.1 hypothetical protein [Actinophytocola algeriensis]
MDRSDVAAVLDGLRFPAYRWEVIAQAELYGTDMVTRRRFHRLPARLYADCDDVADTVRATGAAADRRRLAHRYAPVSGPAKGFGAGHRHERRSR